MRMSTVDARGWGEGPAIAEISSGWSSAVQLERRPFVASKTPAPHEIKSSDLKRPRHSPNGAAVESAYIVFGGIAKPRQLNFLGREFPIRSQGPAGVRALGGPVYIVETDPANGSRAKDIGGRVYSSSAFHCALAGV